MSTAMEDFVQRLKAVLAPRTEMQQSHIPCSGEYDNKLSAEVLFSVLMFIVRS